MITKLFEPTNIGKLELKNRIAMAPMWTAFISEAGAMTQRYIDYCVERAKYGVGMILVEPATVYGGAWGGGALTLDDDKFILGLNELVESIKLYGDGVRVGIEFGSMGQAETRPGELAERLTVQEIDEIVEAYGDAAVRAKIAGIEAIIITATGGYIQNQFMSPIYNKRTDEYGGSLENRLRLPLRMIRNIKEKVGEDFPVIFDINCGEFVEGGITIDDAIEWVPIFEEAGVDAFRNSRSCHETYYTLVASGYFPRGVFAHFGERLKKAVKKAKVIVDGRINSPEVAEEILQADKADVIVVGRALLADPEWSRKAAEGRLEDIRKCVTCNVCLERVFYPAPSKCSVNAQMGHEREYKLTPAGRVKKVVVVGGGPAGMEAARVAAVRGHKVTLFEKENKLGGQLNLACAAPHKEEMRNILEYLTHQLGKLELNVRLGEKATIGKIEEIKPDVVILATGAKPRMPKVPGVNRKNVVQAWDVLSNRTEVGDKVVVVGGGRIGCETAEFLADEGKKVTIIEMIADPASAVYWTNRPPLITIGFEVLPDIAKDVNWSNRYLLVERLKECGIQILAGSKLEEITDKGVIYSKNSAKKTLEADTVVLALISVSNKGLMAEIKGKVPELYSVGDCAEIGQLLEAIHRGFHVGRVI